MVHCDRRDPTVLLACRNSLSCIHQQQQFRPFDEPFAWSLPQSRSIQDNCCEVHNSDDTRTAPRVFVALLLVFREIANEKSH